jgi:hypothetical protein
MTVFVYVNTSKEVGDRDHLKVFENADAAETGSRKTTLKASRSSTTSSNNVAQPLDVWLSSAHTETRAPVPSARGLSGATR